MFARNRAITACYAGWYRERPELQWAGMTCAASWAAGQLLRALRPDGVAARVAPDLAGLCFALVRETNDAIFRELGWAHVAWLEGGLAAVEAAHGPGRPPLLRGFAALEAARRSADPRDAAALAGRGLWLLLAQEQRHVAQPFLDRYPRDFRSLSTLLARADFTLGDPRVPQRRSPSFTAYALRRGWFPDVTRLPQRWAWLEDRAVPAWRALHAERPAAWLDRLDELRAARERGPETTKARRAECRRAF